MDNHKLYEMVVEANKIDKIPLRLTELLIYWFIAKDDGGFGFKEARGLHDQLEMAIDFLVSQEKLWYYDYTLLKTSLLFPFYLTDKAKINNIDFPENFIETLKKGSSYELSSIE